MDPRLREAGPADGREDHPHRRRAEIETKHLGFTISPHEECGVEEAVRLVEANGGESVAPRSARQRPRSSYATRWRSEPTARCIS